jgi:hypothetical protein
MSAANSFWRGRRSRDQLRQSDAQDIDHKKDLSRPVISRRSHCPVQRCRRSPPITCGQHYPRQPQPRRAAVDQQWEIDSEGQGVEVVIPIRRVKLLVDSPAKKLGL